jgi:hypothetical protein
MRGSRRVIGTAAAMLALAAPAVRAQTAARAVGTGVIAGTVYDSVSHRPLAGAVVDLVASGGDASAAGSTTSDSLGRYEFGDVPPADYVIGFFHPRLDLLGVQAPLRAVRAVAGKRVRVDLAVPSARGLRAVICTASAGDSTALLIGHVEDATAENSVEGAMVVAQWASFTFEDGRLLRSLPTVRARTSASGWFALCDLPADTPISLQASHDADSSGVVDVEVRAADLGVRTLYVAPTTTVAIAPTDSASGTDSVAIPAERVYRGSGRLTGVVRDDASNLPIGGVLLTVRGTGLTATTTDSGQFSFAQLPLGTQLLMARKVGRMPTAVPVDLLAGSVARADVVLPTIASVMDTVKIRAMKVYAADVNGFVQRQTTRFGRFFDADQIARLAPFETTDLLRRVAGIRMSFDGFQETLVVRATGGILCHPDIYVDGIRMMGTTPEDLDMIVRPEQIAGLEVYTEAVEVPPQFQFGNTCAALVVWTQRARPD